MQHYAPQYTDTGAHAMNPLGLPPSYPPPMDHHVHHHHHHHEHQHPTYSQVRVKYEAGCFSGGGFPEYVPLEVRGRVSDVDYVSHIRNLNSDLHVAGRWGWGILVCFLGIVGCIIALAASFFSSVSDISNMTMPRVNTIWPWAVVAGLFLVGVIAFSIVRAAKTKAVLRNHAELFNADLGGDTGLVFHMETKIKEIKHAKERWDPVLKKHVKPKQVKMTLVIDVGPPGGAIGGQQTFAPGVPGIQAAENPHWGV